MVKAQEKDEPKILTRGQERREAILLAASNLLVERGYAAFSARAVASEAGLHLSHVQYYFAHADDIIAELLNRFIGQYGDAVLTQFRNASGSADKRLGKAIAYLLNDLNYRTTCTTFMLEVAGLAARNEVIAAALQHYYAVYLDALAEMLAEANPALNATARRVRAQQCLALIEGTAMTGRFAAQSQSPQALTQALLMLITSP